MLSEYVKIELECSISVQETVVVNDILPKAIIFFDTELSQWIISNDMIKKFRIAGLGINIHSPPSTYLTLPTSPLYLGVYYGS